MPLPKIVTPVHFLGFLVFQPFHFSLFCFLHVSDFPNCAFYTCLIFQIVHVLSFASLRGFLKISSILSVMLQFGFFAFHLSTYRPGLGSLSCCFDVCFLTLHVSLSFFAFSFLTCMLPFCFLAFVSVLFSCLFCYMHVIFSFSCVGRGLVCMLAYRVCLFMLLLLFCSGAVFMCVLLHACQLFIFLCRTRFCIFCYLIVFLFSWWFCC